MRSSLRHFLFHFFREATAGALAFLIALSPAAMARSSPAIRASIYRFSDAPGLADREAERAALSPESLYCFGKPRRLTSKLYHLTMQMAFWIAAGFAIGQGQLHADVRRATSSQTEFSATSWGKIPDTALKHRSSPVPIAVKFLTQLLRESGLGTEFSIGMFELEWLVRRDPTLIPLMLDGAATMKGRYGTPESLVLVRLARSDSRWLLLVSGTILERPDVWNVWPIMEVLTRSLVRDPKAIKLLTDSLNGQWSEAHGELIADKILGLLSHSGEPAAERAIKKLIRYYQRSRQPDDQRRLSKLKQALTDCRAQRFCRSTGPSFLKRFMGLVPLAVLSVAATLCVAAGPLLAQVIEAPNDQRPAVLDFGIAARHPIEEFLLKRLDETEKGDEYSLTLLELAKRAKSDLSLVPWLLNRAAAMRGAYWLPESLVLKQLAGSGREPLLRIAGLILEMPDPNLVWPIMESFSEFLKTEPAFVNFLIRSLRERWDRPQDDPVADKILSLLAHSNHPATTEALRSLLENYLENYKLTGRPELRTIILKLMRTLLAAEDEGGGDLTLAKDMAGAA